MKLGNLEIKIIESVVVAVVFIVIYVLNKRKVNLALKKFEFGYPRRVIIVKIINGISIITAILFFAGIWGVERSDILMYISSLLTILGIGFFAQWSLLSNITSGIILFFNHPMKIGDHIKIYDKEYDIEGKITDITYFFLHVRTDDEHDVTIPNTIVLNKTISIVPYRETKE